MIKALINGDWENVPEAHLQLGADTFASVSYTHLTLPTNREV